MNAERVKGIGGNVRSEDTLSGPRLCNVRLRIRTVSKDRNKRLRVFLQSANPTLGKAAHCRDGGQPLLLREGQRTKEDRFDESEDRSVGADAQRQGHDGHCGKAAIPSQLARAKFNVRPERME